MIIDDFIKFRVMYERKMLDRFSDVTMDDEVITKLFLAQKGARLR